EQVQQLYPARSYESSVDYNLIFGLGKDTIIDFIQVIWPDGKSQILNSINPNQTLILSYSDALVKNKLINTTLESDNIFAEIKNSGIHFTHVENQFIDFKREPLLPHKYSQNGPGITTGDVNNDGLDDFYIGGAA